MIGSKAICKICGKEFVSIREGNVYCSNACSKQASRKRHSLRYLTYVKSTTPEERIKLLSDDKPKEKYCPMGCKNYSTCGKRLGDEFEHTSSGGGRWRALKGC